MEHSALALFGRKTQNSDPEGLPLLLLRFGFGIWITTYFILNGGRAFDGNFLQKSPFDTFHTSFLLGDNSQPIVEQEID